jgi:hypothetical protein
MRIGSAEQDVGHRVVVAPANDLPYTPRAVKASAAARMGALNERGMARSRLLHRVRLWHTAACVGQDCRAVQRTSGFRGLRHAGPRELFAPSRAKPAHSSVPVPTACAGSGPPHLPRPSIHPQEMPDSGDLLTRSRELDALFNRRRVRVGPAEPHHALLGKKACRKLAETEIFGLRTHIGCESFALFLCQMRVHAQKPPRLLAPHSGCVRRESCGKR